MNVPETQKKIIRSRQEFYIFISKYYSHRKPGPLPIITSTQAVTCVWERMRVHEHMFPSVSSLFLQIAIYIAKFSHSEYWDGLSRALYMLMCSSVSYIFSLKLKNSVSSIPANFGHRSSWTIAVHFRKDT